MFKSTHNLPFGIAPYHNPIASALGLDTMGYKRFQVGTCEGLWRCDGKNYEILAVVNSQPGNGHFTDVLEWFEQSCIRDKKNLMFVEMMNDDLTNSLQKKGFELRGKNMVKDYRKMQLHVA